jgi:hypothetical protein
MEIFHHLADTAAVAIEIVGTYLSTQPLNVHLTPCGAVISLSDTPKFQRQHEKKNSSDRRDIAKPQWHCKGLALFNTGSNEK